jgi:predicted dehydrogenase
MNPPVVGIGIIGCGNVLTAYTTALGPLTRTGWVRVVAACGREPQRTRARELLGTSAFTTDSRELLEHPDVDAVLILTSMHSHGELVLDALRAGKHVLVEKPLAVALETALRIRELACSASSHLVCAPFVTLSPVFREIAWKVRQGAIGRPLSARARYGWSGPWWNTWFYEAHGGCLFDLGVYCLTTLTGVLGPARRVAALTSTAIAERTVEGRPMRPAAEDNAQVLLDFGAGALACVTTGFTIQQYRCPALEIYGSDGTIQMLGDDWAPEGYELWENARGCWQVFKSQAPEWHWTDGLRELVTAIRAQHPPRLSVDHALHVLEIMLQAKTAARDGRTLPLSTRFDPLPLDAAATHDAAHKVHDRTRREAESPAPPTS